MAAIRIPTEMTTPGWQNKLWWKAHVAWLVIGFVVVVGAVVWTVVSVRNDVPAIVIGLTYAAAGFGAAVGATELISRYKDAPATVVGGVPGLLYLALNAAASLIAFVVIRAMGWRFGVSGTGDSNALLATQFLVASFGAAALFRTSLFTVKAGNQDIGVGPSAALTIALAAADRAVDRRRALWRGAEANQVMRKVDFDSAVLNLVPYCFQVALQNVSTEEQAAVGTIVNSLKSKEHRGMSPRVKSMVLGAALLSVVGYNVLYRAVDTLCEDIKMRDVTKCIDAEPFSE